MSAIRGPFCIIYLNHWFRGAKGLSVGKSDLVILQVSQRVLHCHPVFRNGNRSTSATLSRWEQHMKSRLTLILIKNPFEMVQFLHTLWKQ